MSETLPRMTEAEYLAWEARQDRPYEFDGCRPLATTGGTIAHEIIQGNLRVALGIRLRGGPCRAFGPTIRVPTGRGRYRYPDAVVTCTPQDSRSRDLTDPVVIFEVASDSTFNEDRGAKLIEYRSLPSLVNYVMIEQTSALVTVITRAGDLWAIDVLRAGEVLHLPEIDVELPLDNLYDGLDLPPEEP